MSPVWTIVHTSLRSLRTGRVSAIMLGARRLPALSPTRYCSRLLPRTANTASTQPPLLRATPESSQPASFPAQQDQQPCTPSAAPTPEKHGFWQTILAQGKDKEKLAQLGFGAFCAYGVISNLNAACMITIAWITVVKTTGLMPLAPGNWPKFLAVYAGLWVTSNFMRPIRLSLAIAVAPFFETALNAIMRWTGQKNKFAAFGIMLLLIAAGSISTVVLAIAVAGGFPMGS